MKKFFIATTVAVLAIASGFQTVAKADDPITPVPGAVCSLYEDKEDYGADKLKSIDEFFASLSSRPALATFVDTAGDFKDTEKKDGIQSNVGKWTGWLKQEQAGTYTFLCMRGWSNYEAGYRYSICINGRKCIESGYGQRSFNVELRAGFNSVEIITEGYCFDAPHPLSISYKKAGSLKEPEPFGPGDMFHDDEE